MGDNRVKVIHIITRLDKGGSAENTMLTALDQARRGYEVMIVRGDPMESGMSSAEEGALAVELKEAAALGVRVVTIRLMIRRVQPFYDLWAVWILYKLIRKEAPRIVHTHTSKAGILGRIAARLAGIKGIIHTPHGHVFYGHYGRWMTAIFTLTERVVAIFTHRIITLTERGIDEYIEHGVGKREQYIAIPSGIDVPGVQRRSSRPPKMRAKLDLPPSCLLVGTVGKMGYVKGQSVLISAAKKVIEALPSTRFVMVGEGPLEKKLRLQARELGLEDHLQFVAAWGEEAWDWIDSLDLFVLPSRNEGMGRVLLEAMALGKPVVASYVGGIPNVVLDGKTGILVPPDEPSKLSEAIIRVLLDSELRHQFGEEGRKRCDSRFSADVMTDRIEQLYREYLNVAEKI